jgi:hypothetical protein
MAADYAFGLLRSIRCSNQKEIIELTWRSIISLILCQVLELSRDKEVLREFIWSSPYWRLNSLLCNWDSCIFDSLFVFERYIRY